MLQETVITRAVVESFTAKFLSHIENDVVIVGAGPSGLVLGTYLARAGVKTALYEKKLSPGGGICEALSMVTTSPLVLVMT